MPYLSHPSSSPEVEGGQDQFHRLVNQLSNVLGPCSGIDSEEIEPNDLINLMREYISNEAEWRQYAFADSSRNYTRNLVDEGNGKSNLLIIVWNPGKSSPVHDHAQSHCIMKILQGQLKETLYSLPPVPVPDQPNMSAVTPPTVTKETIYHENEVTYISDDIGVHKISNPSDTPAVSLHLYTPPHAANFGFNLFDEETGKVTHIKQAGFFSDRGERLAVCGPGNL